MDALEYICFFQNLNILWSFFPVQSGFKFLGSTSSVSGPVLITLVDCLETYTICTQFIPESSTAIMTNCVNIHTQTVESCYKVVLHLN
jgi:hypothetical protein